MSDLPGKQNPEQRQQALLPFPSRHLALHCSPFPRDLQDEEPLEYLRVKMQERKTLRLLCDTKPVLRASHLNKLLFRSLKRLPTCATKRCLRPNSYRNYLYYKQNQPIGTLLSLLLTVLLHPSPHALVTQVFIFKKLRLILLPVTRTKSRQDT